MNRLLLTDAGIDVDGVVSVVGNRAAHIRDVLKLGYGDTLRVGLINGPTGTAEILRIGNDSVKLRCVFDGGIPDSPRIDLLLALPRPKVMKRLWAPLASMGVGRIILTNAAKVERNYFDTHWLQPSKYTPLLREGLEQSGDTRMPQVDIKRRLKPFVEDELNSEFYESHRILFHPRNAMNVSELEVPEASRILIAVGPEGGWTDYELEMFEKHGFQCISMGWRVLRTDTACIALIAIMSSSQLR